MMMSISINNRLTRTYLSYALVAALSVILSACGGGSDLASSSAGVAVASSSPSAVSLAAINLATPAGTACTSSFSNTDAFGNIKLKLSQGTTPWGCLVVDQANSQPTYSGSQSVRFEVREGDCDATQTFISGSDLKATDCSTSRSRYEIYENSGNSTEGQIITYEYSIYVPTQPLIQPAPSKGASSTPLTVLTQINWSCSTNAPCPTIGSNGYGALAFLKTDYTGALYLQTHKDFTWTTNQVVTIDTKPQDKWVKLKYVIKSTAEADGFIWIFVNDKLVINETRSTLPNSSAKDALKFGIYNSSKSSGAVPWQTQVVYFDGFSTLVQNFK